MGAYQWVPKHAGSNARAVGKDKEKKWVPKHAGSDAPAADSAQDQKTKFSKPRFHCDVAPWDNSGSYLAWR